MKVAAMFGDGRGGLMEKPDLAVAGAFAVEGHPYRVALARQLRATEVLDPSDGDTAAKIPDRADGIGADRAVDCSEAPRAQRLMIDSLRRKGRAAFVGEGGELSIAVSREMIRKGISL